MQRLALLLLLVLGGAVADPAAAQLSSVRSQSLGPTLAGLMPDDWSGGLLNPARAPAGGLAFGRVDWSSGEPGAGRAVVGARAAMDPFAVLVAASRVIPSTAGPAPGHTVLGLRYGRRDAIGLRYARRRSSFETGAVPVEAVGLGTRMAAGKGWVVEFMGETAGLRLPSAAPERYHAAAIVLRQPGPERLPSDAGWDHRLLRVQGGGGTGDFAGGDERPDDLRWLDAAAVHLHGFERAGLRLAVAWAARYTRYRVDRSRCAPPCADPSAGSRAGDLVALDVGIEAWPLSPLAIRSGLSLPVVRTADSAELPPRWRRAAALEPGRFRSGLWFGVGWQPGAAFAVDAAVDALRTLHSGPRRAVPVSLQATYRF